MTTFPESRGLVLFLVQSPCEEWPAPARSHWIEVSRKQMNEPPRFAKQMCMRKRGGGGT